MLDQERRPSRERARFPAARASSDEDVVVNRANSGSLFGIWRHQLAGGSPSLNECHPFDKESLRRHSIEGRTVSSGLLGEEI